MTISPWGVIAMFAVIIGVTLDNDVMRWAFLLLAVIATTIWITSDAGRRLGMRPGKELWENGYVIAPRVSGIIVYLDDDAFDEFEKQCREPGKPTEAAKRGAKLLNELYGKKK